MITVKSTWEVNHLREGLAQGLQNRTSGCSGVTPAMEFKKKGPCSHGPYRSTGPFGEDKVEKEESLNRSGVQSQGRSVVEKTRRRARLAA